MKATEIKSKALHYINEQITRQNTHMEQMATAVYNTKEYEHAHSMAEFYNDGVYHVISCAESIGLISWEESKELTKHNREDREEITRMTFAAIDRKYSTEISK